MQTELIRFTGSIARVQFDKERKLKATHSAISWVLTLAQKELGRAVSLQELNGDLFVGQRLLILALLKPNLQPNEKVSLDKVSELIDEYRKQGGKLSDLQDAVTELLADYLGVEVTRQDDEDEEARPNEPASASDAGA
jgi:hypothetical protein